MYSFQLPHPSLRSFIRGYWSLRLDDMGNDDSPMWVLPDGCVELIVHLGTPYESRLCEAPQSQAFIAGQIKRAIQLLPESCSHVFAIRFQPHGLHAFTPIPIRHFTHREVDLEHLWSSNQMLVDAIYESSSFEHRCALADQFFGDLLGKMAIRPDPLIAWCVEKTALGQYRVADLAAGAGLSTRQLERRFLQTIGLSPKRFTRIVRLQQAVAQLERGVSHLTHLAYDLGYADQAHMTRDFKQLTGMTPSHYLRKEERLYFEGVATSP